MRDHPQPSSKILKNARYTHSSITCLASTTFVYQTKSLIFINPGICSLDDRRAIEFYREAYNCGPLTFRLRKLNLKQLTL